MEQERPRWGREAADKWAREEAGAARCLVCLKHAGLDPTQERDGKEAAVGGGKRGAQAGGGGGGPVARLVCGVVHGAGQHAGRGGRDRGTEPRWASQLTPRGWRMCRDLLEREQAPEAIQGRTAPGKRRGSQLADESLTKRRSEGT